MQLSFKGNLASSSAVTLMISKGHFGIGSVFYLFPFLLNSSLCNSFLLPQTFRAGCLRFNVF